MGATSTYRSFFGLPLLDVFARNTVYQADSDGYLNVGSTNMLMPEIGVYIQVNTTNPPSTYRAKAYESSSIGYRHLIVPVRRGEYWKVSCASSYISIDWFPHL